MRLGLLYIRYKKQSAEGAVYISEEDFPNSGQLAALFLGSQQAGLLVQQPQISSKTESRKVRTLSPDVVADKSRLRLGTRLARQFAATGHKVELHQVGSDIKIRVDGTFYNLIELLELRKEQRRHAFASLKSSTRLETRTLKSTFYRPEIVGVRVNGTLTSGENVEAYFTSEGNRLAVVPNLRSKEDLILNRVYHPEVAALDFSGPLFLLSTTAWPGSATTIPVAEGLRFVTAYQLGPNLRQSVTSPMPNALIGKFSGSPKGLIFTLKSTPFHFTFGPTQIEYISLRLYGRWNEEAESKEYDASLSGIWRAGNLVIPVWTMLPMDDGLMCWNSVGAQNWLDPEATGANLRSRGLKMRLNSPADASPLMADWDGWFNRWPILVNLLQHAAPLYLVHVQLGVDCISRQPSDVALTILGSGLRIRGFPAQISRIYCSWSVGNPWNPAARSIFVEVRLQLTIGQIQFDAVMRPPSFALRARSTGTMDLQTAIQALGCGAPSLDDRSVYIHVELDFVRSTLLVQAIYQETHQKLELLRRNFSL